MAIRERQIATQAAPGPIQKNPLVEGTLSKAAMWDSISKSVGSATFTYISAVNADEVQQAQIHVKDKLQEYKNAVEANKIKSAEDERQNVLEGGAMSIDSGISPANMMATQMETFDAFSKELRDEVSGGMTFAGGRNQIDAYMEESINTAQNTLNAQVIEESIGIMNSRSALRINKYMSEGTAEGFQSAEEEAIKSELYGITSHTETMSRIETIRTGRAKVLTEKTGKQAFDDAVKYHSDGSVDRESLVEAEQAALDSVSNATDPYLTEDMRDSIDGEMTAYYTQQRSRADQLFQLKSDELFKGYWSELQTNIQRGDASLNGYFDRLTASFPLIDPDSYARLWAQARSGDSAGKNTAEVPGQLMNILTENNVDEVKRTKILELVPELNMTNQEIIDVLALIPKYGNKEINNYYQETKTQIEDLRDEFTYGSDEWHIINTRILDLNRQLNLASTERVLTLEDVQDISNAHLAHIPGIEDLDYNQKSYNKALSGNANQLNEVFKYFEINRYLSLTSGSKATVTDQEQIKIASQNEFVERYGVLPTFSYFEEVSGLPVFSANIDGSEKLYRPQSSANGLIFLSGEEGAMVPYDAPTIVELRIEGGIERTTGAYENGLNYLDPNKSFTDLHRANIDELLDNDTMTSSEIKRFVEEDLNLDNQAALNYIKSAGELKAIEYANKTVGKNRSMRLVNAAEITSLLMDKYGYKNLEAKTKAEEIIRRRDYGAPVSDYTTIDSQRYY